MLSENHNQNSGQGSLPPRLREFEELVKDWYSAKTDLVKKRYHRSLPLSEMLVDRWEKARDLNFGKNVSIYDSSVVLGDVSVGEGTWIGPFTILDGSGGLTIGKNSCISAGVHIYTHDSVKKHLSGRRMEDKKKPVAIGECTFIGASSIILSGVTIGDHCLIGANSLVTRDIPPYSIAVGSPARLIGKVVIDETGEIILDTEKKYIGILDDI